MLCSPCSLCSLVVNLVIWACMATICLYFRLSIRDCKCLTETVRQHETKAIHARTVISRYAWITTVRDWTVYSSYTAPSPCVKKKNSFNKLIRVIQIFIRKYFVVQHYPRNIFNIKLFPNYGIYRIAGIFRGLKFSRISRFPFK